MIFTRTWAMPSAHTFTIKPIADLLSRYITADLLVVDPFARDSEWAALSNDLDPTSKANFHMDAIEFLDMLLAAGIHVDAALLDPPYSARQISEHYKAVGRKVTMQDTQLGPLRQQVCNRLDLMLRPGGIVISCGWSTSNMGKKRGYEFVEIMLVAHGGAHNDTIVTVERKLG